MDQNFETAAAKLGLSDLVPEISERSETKQINIPTEQSLSRSFPAEFNNSRGDIYDHIAQMLRHAVAQEAAEIAGRIVNDQGRLRGI